MKKTKKSILVTYDRDFIFDVQVVEIPDDFQYGIDDQYGDKIPFTLGSNQQLREYDLAVFNRLQKIMEQDRKDTQKGCKIP